MQNRTTETPHSDKSMGPQEQGKQIHPNGNNHSSGDPKRPLSFIKEGDTENLPYNFEMRKIFRGLLRHLGIILAFMLIFAGIGGYLSYRYIHTYHTEAVLIYSAQERGGSTDVKYQILHLTLPSAVEMVTLPTHLKAVKSILGLDLSIEKLKEMISISIPARESNLITINVTGDNPSLVIDIANTLANVVVKSTQDLIQRQWQAAYTYLKNQEDNLRQKVEEKTKEISDFRKEYRFSGAGADSSSSLEGLKFTEAKLDAVDLEYTRMQVEYENLSREFGKIPENLPIEIVQDSILRNRITQIEGALLDARSKYAPENPKIKALEFQLRELKKSLQEEKNQPGPSETVETKNTPTQPNPLKERLNLELIGLQAKLRSQQKLKEELSEQIQNQKRLSSHWSEEQATYTKLLSQKTFLDEQLRTNERTQRSMEMILSLGKGDLEIYQPAEKAFSYETSLWVELLPALMFILGTFLGIGCAFALEITDKKIRSTRQLEMAYHLPCLVTIPELHLLLKKNAERKMRFYIRNLLDRIHLFGSFSSLAVTSATYGEGKSSLAYHLALHYANMGKKTLLLEFDYRVNPNFTSEAAAPAFLENYLKGQVSLEDILYHGHIDRIKVADDLEMKELMKSDQIKGLWNTLKQAYEMIIIDTPGIIEDESAIKAAGLADQVIFVIGSSKSDKDYIDTALKEMEVFHVKPCGIVLNRVLPVYVDNLRVTAQSRQNKLRFFENLFQRKPPK